MLRKTLLALLMLAPFAAGADQASDQLITETLKKNIRMVRHLALNPLLADAVQRQNASDLDMETIRRRDRSWSDGGFPAVNADMHKGHHGLMMKRFIERNTDFSEAVLTDSRGANVAAYPAAEDYWQGDRAGWRKAFNEGRGQVYISPLEQDASTGLIQTYIAAPVLRRNQAVGVLLVSVQLSGG